MVGHIEVEATEEGSGRGSEPEKGTNISRHLYMIVSKRDYSTALAFLDWSNLGAAAAYSKRMIWVFIYLDTWSGVGNSPHLAYPAIYCKFCFILRNSREYGNKHWSLLSHEDDRRWHGHWRAPALLLNKQELGRTHTTIWKISDGPFGP